MLASLAIVAGMGAAGLIVGTVVGVLLAAWDAGRDVDAGTENAKA